MIGGPTTEDIIKASATDAARYSVYLIFLAQLATCHPLVPF
jgi:hypothetical protein